MLFDKSHPFVFIKSLEQYFIIILFDSHIKDYLGYHVFSVKVHNMQKFDSYLEHKLHQV